MVVAAEEEVMAALEEAGDLEKEVGKVACRGEWL